MQEITVNKCECPFEVSAIIDLVDLVPGTTYKYKLSLMNAGKAIFHPSQGEFKADGTSETLNIIVHLRDNPNNHYLINLEFYGISSDGPYSELTTTKLRRQIICVKNTSCSSLQCTATPTPTVTPTPRNIDRHRNIVNYTIVSRDEETFGTYRTTITVADWVEFLNSVAQYDDPHMLWKPQMEKDKACGINKDYDGFFYVYSVDGCVVGATSCFPNQPEHLSRTISYVSWSDIARYVNWIANGKPKGRQGPSTTEDGSYPLFGNNYPAPGIDHYPNARFWFDAGIPATPTVTPTNTQTPSNSGPPLPAGINITSQPVSDIFTAIGINRTISVTAVAVPSSITLLYQWQKSTDSGSNWNDISGAVTSSYTITNPQLSDNGAFYRVRISGVASGGGSTPTPVNSSNSVLSVTTAQITITSDPENLTTSGTSGAFSVEANVSPDYCTLSYQWQKSTNSGTTYSNISGANSSTLNLSNLTVADSGSMYRVIVSGNGGATSQTTTAGTLIVTAPQIVISLQPQNVTSFNASATFYTLASIPSLGSTLYNLTYTWQRSSDGGATFTNIPGVGSSTTLTITNLTRSSDNDQYRVVVSSNTAANPVTSNAATLNVADTFGGLLLWGSNNNDQLSYTGSSNLPRFGNNPSNIYRSASLGQNHTILINASGILNSFGINTQGQASANNILNAVKAVTKYNHNLFIISDSNGNSLYACGNNTNGQCGLGTSSTVISSLTAISDTNDYKDIAVGENHSLAVRTDGTLVACGLNSNGQLGTGNNTSQNTFVTITTNIVSVACGQNHSAAIDNSGTLYTWGQNTDGQLGLGNNTNTSAPTAVAGSDWSKVVCGAGFTAALKTNGSLWVWGNNAVGQLGDSTTTSRNSPYQLSGTWLDISAGNTHVIGIKIDGSLWAWGNNLQGQLGNGTNINSSSPVQISANGDTYWESVYAGGNSSAAIRSGAILTISANPQSVESLAGAASFSVSASATNYAQITYQWQVSTDSGINWSNINGSTNNILYLSNLNTTFDSYRYRCIVSGSYNAYPIVTAAATLIDKSAAVFYRGTRSSVSSTIPTTPGAIWTQWNEFNYGSVGTLKTGSGNQNTKVTQAVYVDRFYTAFLLSNGVVVCSSANTFGGSSIINNPAGETIVKLIGNPGSPQTSAGAIRYLFAISQSGKIYGISSSSILGSTTTWNRIGTSVNLQATSVAGWGYDSNTLYTSTLYMISASDNTLWAWGDNRLVTGAGSAGTFTFSTAPVRVSTDSWQSVAGNAGGFYGIKSDGGLYRLSGYWGGGNVWVGGTIKVNTGTLTLSGSSVAPVLIDNSTAYSKLSASSSVLIAYDVNNKLHMNPFIDTAQNLPTNWTGVEDILLGTGGSGNAGNGPVIIGTVPSSVPTNVAIATTLNSTNISYYEYGSTIAALYTSTSTGWGTGTTPNSAVRSRFKAVVPDITAGYFIVLKDE